jgi:hypothetical protein
MKISEAAKKSSYLLTSLFFFKTSRYTAPRARGRGGGKRRTPRAFAKYQTHPPNCPHFLLAFFLFRFWAF